LASLEQDDDSPRINDIVAMDRILRRRPYEEALRYLAAAAKSIAEFLASNDILLVSSGRDTALQLIAMLVCRRDRRLWVVPTRTRLPRERYGFQTSHQLQNYLHLRDVLDADRKAAENYLTDFRKRQLVAAARTSAGSITDVAARLPLHTRLLFRAMMEARSDRGNRASRYTVADLARMYFRRRVNLLELKAARPYDEGVVSPYALYTLHTQPESSIDVSGSFFSDQIALIGQIARSLPVQTRLYVKIHPSDMDGKSLSFYRRILAIPGVRIIGPRIPSRGLLFGSSLVFTVTGTIAYEAGLLGMPAITFAKLYFNQLPSVHYCESISELPTLVAQVLRARPTEGEAERASIVEFLANLYADSVPGDVNRIHEPLTSEDLDTLAVAYRRLFELVGEYRASFSHAHQATVANRRL
jgi:hypothetical protein